MKILQLAFDYGAEVDSVVTFRLYESKPFAKFALLALPSEVVLVARISIILRVNLVAACIDMKIVQELLLLHKLSQF